MPAPQAFVQNNTPAIGAEWLNQVDTLIATVNGPPTSGTYNTGDFKKNANITLFGQTGAQYIIWGWFCVLGGTPGTWMAVQLPVGQLSGSATPTPPAPSPTLTYAYRIQAESMTGAVLVNSIPGYDGTGFADWATSSGVTLTGTFPNVPAGNFTVNIRYFAYGSQQNNIQFDAGAVTLKQYPASNPAAWNILTIPGVALGAGSHTFKFISDWGFVYYDYVELVQETAATPAPPPPAPAPAPAPGSAPFYPFGARTDGAYPFGITITGQTNAAMDAVVKSAYTNWKNNRLAAVPSYTPSTGLFAGNTLNGLYADKFSTPTQTVSEGIGYAMLILVLMAGYDANAKVYFDGMFRFARAFPAYGDYLPNGVLAGSNIQNYLLDWKVDISTMTSLGGGFNAADGDLDIALALFMAHRQWGSAASTTTTQINYYQEGLNVVAALKAVNFATNGVMYVGAQFDMHRTSDTMPFAFKVFKAATADTFWDNAVANSATLVSGVISSYANTTKMPPDWIWHPLTNAPQPSPGNLMEGPNEGNYAANAIRCPWRWGHGYLFYGTAAYKTLCNNLLAWFETTAPTSGNPSQTSWGYTLAGIPFSTPNYFDPATNSGLMVGAMVGGNAGDQAYLNACWTAHAANLQTGYYNTELQLLAMIIASGNWWKPF